MNEHIEKILLRTSQSIKELKIVNENIKKLDKKISKIVFEEKKRIVNKMYIKDKKYFLHSSN